MVETPEASKTVPTWKPQKAATKTVAGNMVKTCWKPSRINCAGGGVSFGR
jgi:hypothetical protein